MICARCTSKPPTMVIGISSRSCLRNSLRLCRGGPFTCHLSAVDIEWVGGEGEPVTYLHDTLLARLPQPVIDDLVDHRRAQARRLKTVAHWKTRDRVAYLIRHALEVFQGDGAFASVTPRWLTVDVLAEIAGCSRSSLTHGELAATRWAVNAAALVQVVAGMGHGGR